MATQTKRTRATLVNQSTVEEVREFLQSLPENPKEDLSLKEVIDKLREPLQAALAKGYSYQDLAAQLEKQGIHISATTLKNYLPSGRRSGKAQSSTTTRKRVAKRVQSDTAEVAVEPSTSPTQSAPQRRGRKPKAAAIATPQEAAESNSEKSPRRSGRAAQVQANSKPTTRGRSTTRSKSSKA
jgi:hypothetical protein